MLYEPVHHVLTGSYVTVNDDVFHKRGIKLSIQNQSTDFVKVVLSDTEPTPDASNYVLIPPLDCRTLSSDNRKLWVTGVGPISVCIPDEVTYYDLGASFRSYRDVSIPTGESVIIKVVIPIDVEVTNLTLTVDTGTIRLRTLIAPTELTSFITQITPRGKNNLLHRPFPYYTTQVQLYTDGTISGGVEIDLARLVAGNNANTSTVGGDIQNKRGVAAGTYYFELFNPSNGTSTGVFYSNWDELYI